MTFDTSYLRYRLRLRWSHAGAHRLTSRDQMTKGEDESTGRTVRQRGEEQREETAKREMSGQHDGE